MFCQKSRYCPLSRHREFTFTAEADKRPCCFWTEADKSILANQHAVIRSGDKATFTLKRCASWEEFRQSWLKWSRMDHFDELDEPVISSSGCKRKIKAETARYNGEGTDPCIACNHIHKSMITTTIFVRHLHCLLRRSQRLNKCCFKL